MPFLGKGAVAGQANKLKNNLSPIPSVKQFGNGGHFTGD
jgi:hypothetical protein